MSCHYKTPHCIIFTGMNAAVRAVVRMGMTCGARVYLIHEASLLFFCNVLVNNFKFKVGVQSTADLNLLHKACKVFISLVTTVCFHSPCPIKKYCSLCVCSNLGHNNGSLYPQIVFIV